MMGTSYASRKSYFQVWLLAVIFGLLVTACGGDGTGGGPEPKGGGTGDPGGTIAAATPITLPASPISENIDPLGDVDFFRFSVSAGSRVTIDIDAAATGSSLDSFLRLFNSSGTEIAFNDDEPASSDSLINHVLSTTGNYFIAVSAFSDSSTGAYSLKVAIDAGQAGGPTLTVRKSGTGSGTISSSPAGINNCSAICTASFPSGTPVTLRAFPATGSNFTRWSDPSCAGIGPCTLTITENKSVIATFGTTTPNPTPPPPNPGGVFGNLSISGGGASVVGTSFVPTFRSGSLSNLPPIGDFGLLSWSVPNTRGGHPSLRGEDLFSLAITGKVVSLQFLSKTISGSGTPIQISIVVYSLACGVAFPTPTPASIIECEKISINTTTKTITFNNARLTFSSVSGGSIINTGPIILNGTLIWQ